MIPKLRLLASLTALTLAACSGSGDDQDDTVLPTRDGGVAERDGGTVTNPNCPDLGPALTAPNVAPLRRGDMASAYDPECEILYMAYGDKAEPENCGFAGSDFIDDIHAFDLNAGTWHELTVSGGDEPLPRARSQGIWDPLSKRLVVFGGRYRVGTMGQYTFLNDLWAFDPMTKTWEELSTQDAPGAPSGRMNFSMTLDEDRNVIIIHGGGTTDFNQFFPNSQTWIWNLAQGTWLEVPVSGGFPPERLFHSAAYDHDRQRLYVFAGAGEDAFLSFGDGNMWFLDFTTFTWTEIDQGAPLPPPGAPDRYVTHRPRARIKGKMIEDRARDRILLFGGHDDLDLGNNNDLWALDLATQTWSLVNEGDTPGDTEAISFCEFAGNFAMVDLDVPERRESHFLVKAGSDLAVMYGGRTDCGLANDTWTLDLTNDTWNQITVSPNGMTCVRNGNPNCSDPSARMCD